MPFLASAAPDSELFEAINSAVNAVKARGDQAFLDDTKVCYEEIGCFSKTGPMKQIGSLPDSLAKIDTRYFVYSHSAPSTAHELIVKNVSSLSAVAQSQPLAIVIHGFNNNGQTPELISLKDSLLINGKVPTVIVVDWAKGAQSPWYAEAATNTQVVGRQVALLVNHLKASRGIKPESVHLLGFSLGSQIAGYAGKFSQSEYKWKFGRISALDSAAPLFEGYPGSYLTHEDAIFVDAIHTSAGNNLLIGQVGFIAPIGHVDFFPNGGKKQPRCSTSFHLTCDHYSSVLYMDASLKAHTKCLFKAFKCDSYDQFKAKTCKDTNGDSQMGYSSASLPGRGNHYLNTTNAYPFC